MRWYHPLRFVKSSFRNKSNKNGQSESTPARFIIPFCPIKRSKSIKTDVFSSSNPHVLKSSKRFLAFNHVTVVKTKNRSQNPLKTIVFLLVFINHLIINKKIVFLKTILKTRTCFQRIILVFILMEQADIVSRPHLMSHKPHLNLA